GAADVEPARAGETAVQSDGATLAAWHVRPGGAVERVGRQQAARHDVAAGAERPPERALREVAGAHGLAGDGDIDRRAARRAAVRAGGRRRQDHGGHAAAAGAALAGPAGMAARAAVLVVGAEVDAAVAARREAGQAARGARAARADLTASAGVVAATAVHR